jgi:hypothetical protein
LKRPEAPASPRRVQQGECGPLCAERAAADRFADNVLPVIEGKGEQCDIIACDCRALNARGIATARGGVWTPVQVTGVLRRVS